MDSIQNPFSPGAGSPPSDLVGRDQDCKKFPLKTKAFHDTENERSKKTKELYDRSYVAKSMPFKNDLKAYL